jgi:Zn finger protein HypA/HybF involved in hydrogenase expression
VLPPSTRIGSARPRYFRNMLPEVALAACPHCAHFFHAEELELEVLKTDACPVCASPAADLVWGP